MVDIITGPPCRKCGCQHSEVEETGTYFGTTVEKRRCRYCGTRFTHNIAPVDTTADVPYVSDLVHTRCPFCKAKNPRVTKTLNKGLTTVRYHECVCEKTFPSVEKHST